MNSKHSEVEEFAECFADFYRETLPNFKDEAISLGISERCVYHYADYRQTANQLKAYQIPFSTIAPEIIQYLKDQLKDPPEHLDGSIDDEWAELSGYFGTARKRFKAGEKYDALLEHEFISTARRLFDEWKNKDK